VPPAAVHATVTYVTGPQIGLDGVEHGRRRRRIGEISLHRRESGAALLGLAAERGSRVGFRLPIASAYPAEMATQRYQDAEP